MSFIVSILGMIVIVVALFDLYRAFASRSWSATQGVITLSDARIVSAVAETRKPLATKNQVSFYYDYTVNGENHLGSRILFGDTFTSMISFLAAKNMVEKYKEGQQVTIYYNPSKPQDSVLEPGAKWQAYASLVFGIVLMAIAPMF